MPDRAALPKTLILGNVNGGPVPIRFGFADSLATIDYRLPVIADDWIKKPHSLKRLLNQPRRTSCWFNAPRPYRTPCRMKGRSSG